MSASTERMTHIVSVTPVPLHTDSRTLKQALSFARLGYRSTVIADGVRHDVTPDFRLPATRQTAAAAGAARRGWQSLRAKAGLPWLGQAMLFLAWLAATPGRRNLRLWRRLPAADLYVLHEFSQYPAIWLRRRLTGGALIYDAHDFYTGIESAEMQSGFDRNWLFPFFRRLEAACIRASDAVLTVSDSLVTLLRDAYGAEATVLRNAHDPSLDNVDAGGLKERLGLDDSHVLIVTIGNHKPGQATETFLAALQQLPAHVHVAFIGRGYESLQPQIARLGLEGRAHIPGAAAPGDIVPWARTADAAAVIYYARSANYAGALPNGLFQSLGAALPIFYPDLPEIRNLAERENFGICVDWASIPAIVASLDRFAGDTGLRQAERERSRQAGTRLSWISEEEHLKNAILRVLANAG
ncbi:glycosyltransferase [Ferrovibrio sp.]|uniref:glycosyltransferase n=1 Tax=Ferrovibrio sp. TaxID=1917215 RepID=UPI0035B0429C